MGVIWEWEVLLDEGETPDTEERWDKNLWLLVWEHVL